MFGKSLRTSVLLVVLALAFAGCVPAAPGRVSRASLFVKPDTGLDVILTAAGVTGPAASPLRTQIS